MARAAAAAARSLFARQFTQFSTRAHRLTRPSLHHTSTAAAASASRQELLSDAELKAREAERLRAAERFMMVGTGEADCSSCGYVYVPRAGDPEYPVAPGTQFSELPKDWQCPVCGAEKPAFKLRLREVAGFAENQGYGLGANTMTGEQKSLLIFGSLLAFFALFLLGYTMD